MSGARLEELLLRERTALARFVRAHAGSLLAFENLDDLVQGVQLRALATASGFEDQGEAPFRAWLFTLARRHLADRRDHWQAAKRGASRVLRHTVSIGALPATSVSGPATVAERRELLALAARALEALPQRDRQLVRWASERVPVAEQAERLGIGYAAAQRAGLRSLERFRKAFALLARR